MHSTGQATGSPAPLRWLSAVVWPTPAQQMGWQADVHTVTAQTARVPRRACELPEQGHTWRWAPGVEARQALRGGQFPVAVTTGAALGDLTRFDHPRQGRHALGLTPLEEARGARRQPGSIPKTGHTPCPACPRRRRLGLPGAGHRQSAPPTAPGKAPRSAPGAPWEGAGPPRSTRSPAAGHREKCQARGGRHGPSMACLPVGHRPAGTRASCGRKIAMRLAPKALEVANSIGRGAAPVWGHPRRREEAEKYSRSSHEAGPRRRHGRWDSTHGEQRDQPSAVLAPTLPRDKGKKEADGRKVAPSS
jgi:hypothetical protein